MPAKTYLTHIQSFCAAHRLHNPDLSDEDNRLHFGKCNHPSSHGHNYKIEACVVGEIDPRFGFAMNLVDLKKVLVQVIDPLDHKRIDTDIDFFKQKGIIATAENIALYIWLEMEKLLPPNVRLHNIRVHETDKNYIDFKG